MVELGGSFPVISGVVMLRIDELFGLFGLGLFRAVAFVFGLLWGSFLNVVIYRVPRDMSVVRPASHCPGCGKPVAPYDNVPVLSYVILRGRARCCKVRMSPRYPIVELIGGMLSLAIFEVIIVGLPPSTSLAHAAAIYTATFSLCLGLVAAAFIDAEHMYLPDGITIGGAVVGIVTATLRGMPITQSLLGAAVGFFGIWIPFIFLYKGLLGRTGMGLGDAKLLALAGAWFGWPGAVFTLLAGSVQGSVFALGAQLMGIEPKLPKAVLEDLAELEKAAAEGDEEAKKALEEDPLTEDENDAFIVRFFQRLFASEGEPEDATPKDAPGTDAAAKPGEGATNDVPANEAPANDAASTNRAPATNDAAPEPDESATNAPPHESEADVETGLGVASRARIPFGPFLILAILELLFAGDWLKNRLLAGIFYF